MPDYLYALVPAGTQAPTEPGIEGRPVSSWILDEALAVLRSEIDGTTVQPRRRHLIAHDRVLAAAMAAGPVLPLRFAAITEAGPEVVLEELDRTAALERMQRLDGKVEVHLIWAPDERTALRRAARTYPQVRDRGLAAVERGRLVADALTEVAVDDLTAVITQVHSLLVTTGPVESRGRSARVAMLVEFDGLETLLATCGELADRVAAAGTLRTVGGLPPYSFASLDEDLVGG
ncbi:MAG TPA: GvpL/GvpF family gas vesicle protein [Nitriliruptorales bacterium]|nr:GvpL/GvpF family gas vesicle protein [Nitriliruptorales bacterium]